MFRVCFFCSFLVACSPDSVTEDSNTAPMPTEDAGRAVAPTDAKASADAGVTADAETAGDVVVGDDPGTAFDAGSAADGSEDADAPIPDAAGDGALDAPIDAGETTLVAPVAMAFDSVQHNAVPCNGESGSRLEDPCPAGQALIGLYGYHQTYQGNPSWMLGAGGTCGALSLDCVGTACTISVAAADTLPLRGSMTTSYDNIDAYSDAYWERTCLENQVLVGFAGRAGSYVDRFVLRCAPLIVAFDGSEYGLELGEAMDLDSAGGDGGSPFERVDCPNGEVATAAQSYTWGRALNSFSFGCRAPLLVIPDQQ